MRRLRALLGLVLGLLPASPIKNRLLNLLGHDVHPTAVIRPVFLVNVDRLEVGAGSLIRNWNLFRNLRVARIGLDTHIGPSNIIWANRKYRYAEVTNPELVGVFEIGKRALITRHHHIDATGGCIIGDWSAMAGRKSTVLTHSYEPMSHTMGCAPTRISECSFMANQSIMGMGAVLPPRSVLAMGGVLMPGATQEDTLYGGVPAKPLKADITAWKIFDYGEEGDHARKAGTTRPTMIAKPKGG